MNCKDCKWFFPKPVALSKQSNNGECRRNPPRSVQHKGRIIAVFPATGRMGYCGEFTPISSSAKAHFMDSVVEK